MSIQKPMGRDNDEDEFVVGYMCLTDFEYELGMASDGNTVFPEIESCRKYRKCTDSCGIVEVEVRARRIVQSPKEDVDEATP